MSGIIQHFVRLTHKTLSDRPTICWPAVTKHQQDQHLTFIFITAGCWERPEDPPGPGPVNESYKLSQQHQLTGSSFSPQTSPWPSCMWGFQQFFVRTGQESLQLFLSRDNSVRLVRVLAPSGLACWEEDGCEWSCRVYHINYRGHNINLRHWVLNQGEWGKDKSSQNNNCKYISVASLVSTECS